MTNPQQPELRRNGRNDAVQDAKGPGPGARPRGGASRGDEGRPVPRGQSSPYGPAAGQVADDDSDD
ncbi:hypothetical protein O7606_05155 [Micromonospora sp. WMMD882]|uniref:hypothetical protein n=1 Tax=Micromonospora sp. WMMD882 TaxID=3015151 RepID=UPI00248B61F5|nr:hypothetical protein [Micromonospora sp. WMMD882]WBB80780.1 hypothetical protein O7606_05155 [Micromonospora sp. WMMD882]